jgi:hypothetical protein
VLAESTLKRHGYYCRSRRAEKSSRPRSCLGCAASKARCDHRQPQCSRCTLKGVRCQYPASRPHNTDLRARHSDNDASAEFQEASASSLAGLTASNQVIVDGGDAQLNPLSTAPDSFFMDPVDGFIDWNDLDVDFAELMDSQVQNKTVQPLLPDSPSLPALSSSPSSTSQTTQLPQHDFSFYTSIPKTLNPHPRSLAMRVKVRPETQGAANLMFHTLKSYPVMLSRSNIPPPFIHQQLLDSDFGHIQLEPLHNCINLVHMIRSGITGSRKLFWRNVRQECERFCQLVSIYCPLPVQRVKFSLICCPSNRRPVANRYH